MENFSIFQTTQTTTFLYLFSYQILIFWHTYRLRIPYRLPVSVMKHTHQLKIFLVDDNYFQLQIVRQILESNDQFDITTFEDELECLYELHQKPDLVFLDHNLTTLSGYEVLRRIKFFNPDITVVVVSAQEDKQVIANSIKFGALDFIRKDEHMELNLVRVLKNILASKSSSQHAEPSKTFFKKIIQNTFIPPSH